MKRTLISRGSKVKWLYGLFIQGIVLFPSCVSSEAKTMECSHTIRVEKTDTPERIIEKAAHVVPTPNQLEALKNEFIAFIHFGPNTFTRMEWGNGKEDPKIFGLKQLDTDQWCEAMAAAGMKMVLLTVKHHDGFVLWQSRYTRHGIMSTGFREGKGDILKDLSASCRKYGLKLGVYLSPADLYQIENPEGLYGNLSRYTRRTIPREVPGRPFENQTKFEFEVDDYNEYFLNQLFEILTEYGPIHEVWFDGAHPKTKGGQKYNYAAWKKLIHTLAPQAVIFGREDIRWCGNEAGGTRKVEWNVIPYMQDPDTATFFPDMTAEDLGSREQLYKAKYLHYQQAETNTSIREGWFYRDDERQKVRSADDVFDIYERAVGGNSTFLLNIPPNRDGRFSGKDVGVLHEVGERIRKTYADNLLKGGKGAAELLDKDLNSYLPVPAGEEGIIISLDRPVTINRILLQEAVATQGERVEKHVVDAWIDGHWQEIAAAGNIGYKRILRFPEVTTGKLRLRVLEARLTPAIATFSAHYYAARPPRLEIVRTLEGNVTIRPLQQDFNWKAHGEDIERNLNAGFKIYYTTDGSEPDEKSNEFNTPFVLDKGELKAVALLNGEKGEICRENLGFIKKDWKITVTGSTTGRHVSRMAIDEDPHTYWKSESRNASVTLDLGKVHTLTGWAYTPQKENGKGMIAKGRLKVSQDGKQWTEVAGFEFGNLINDPTKRYYYFTKEIAARYVKIEPTEIAGEDRTVAIAELDLF